MTFDMRPSVLCGVKSSLCSLLDHRGVLSRRARTSTRPVNPCSTRGCYDTGLQSTEFARRLLRTATVSCCCYCYCYCYFNRLERVLSQERKPLRKSRVQHYTIACCCRCYKPSPVLRRPAAIPSAIPARFVPYLLLLLLLLLLFTFDSRRPLIRTIRQFIARS
jgi:hypothetical protein